LISKKKASKVDSLAGPPDRRNDPESPGSRPRIRFWLVPLILAGVCLAFFAGYEAGRHGTVAPEPAGTTAGPANTPQPTGDSNPSPGAAKLQDLLAMDDQTLDRADPLEVDLAVARTIPGCESLDVAKYKKTVDEWAERVRAETDRHLYKFQQAPGEYKNSQAYFKALVLATVIGQDFHVGYDVESVSFDKPSDLFIHGVVDQRRGTCVSLPVMYMAIGYRLGYPIRAVTVPRHLFCRWEDPAAGERFNIEAAGAGGLSDYPDEHYKTWPTPCDPRDIESGSALKTLTMREFLGQKLATRGDYYWHKNQRPEAIESYALAHRLCPANRVLYEILTSQVLQESERFPWSVMRQTASRPAGKVARSNASDSAQR
jgi:hypothetical protein